MPILTTLGAACARAWGFTSGLLKDPYFNLTTLLLPGNGTNGAQNNTFLDGSSNNFTITRNGNTTQGTFSPFSQTGWGAVFGSSSTDMLTTASSAAFAFGAGDFTMEAFVYATANQTDNWIIGLHGNCWLRIGSAGKLEFYNAMELNQWVHVAVVRSGTTLTIYKNGSSVAADPVSTNFSTSVACTIGNQSGADRRWNGYISNVRIVKGVAVYTGAFTPPTSPLAATQSAGTNISAITGTQTSLLICQSNRFRDASTNGFAVTANGSVAVTPFSPFAPTQSYSASAVGGSGYFDGSGDYLTANSAGLELGSNLFTVDGWFYCTGYNGGGAIYSSVNTYPSSTGLLFYVNSTGGYVIDVNGTNIISTGTAPLNTWTHFAIVRSSTGSNGVTLYINGSALTPGTSATNFSSTYAVIGRTGFGAASNYWLGYLSGIRVVVGSANVPSSVPTSPPTAITNTALLLNFTNAGVVDATAKNVLETVGNAQISTAQSKWGGGSIYFNGSSSYLMGAANQQYEFGSGDFTIECWVNISASAANGGILGKGPVGSLDNSVWSIEFPASGGTFGFYVFAANSGAFIVSSTTNIKTSTWTHIAVCKSGNNTRLFVNGTQEGSTYTTGYTISNGNNLWIGGGFYAPTTRTITGYVDDVRFTKFARYTANFTPPTAPFPVQ
jgi:hypothetical protein